MRKLFSILLATGALVISSTAFADGQTAGCIGLGQCQGQQQGQAQGQGQLQGQKAYGGDAYSKAYGGKAVQGQQQGQIGINKNYNANKAIAVQGQLQGNKQAVKAANSVTQNYSANPERGNNVAAFAPSISARSTAPCVITYAASGGSGGVSSIFSLGLHVPVKDDDCVVESLIRTGYESNDPNAQKLAGEMYEHQMRVLMEKQGHETVARVLDSEGNAQKVMYSDELKAFIPVQQHPTYRRAAAVVFVDQLLKAGYTPKVNPIDGSGFQRVSFDVQGDTTEILLDEDLIESVVGEIDDDNGAKFERTDPADRS